MKKTFLAFIFLILAFVVSVAALEGVTAPIFHLTVVCGIFLFLLLFIVCFYSGEDGLPKPHPDCARCKEISRREKASRDVGTSGAIGDGGCAAASSC